jgi:hypothetical protein
MTAMPAASTTGPQRMTAVTRDDGGFEMLLDEPGSVVIVASSADGRLRLPQRIIEVPDADAHSVEISYSGVSVTGLVVDKDTEAPLPYAGVYAAPRDPRASGNVGGTAGPDGRFQLEVEPGDYRVGASSREEGYGSAEVEVAVGASGVSDVRVAVPKGLAIAGRLTDMSGRPVVGASVFAQTPEGSGGGYGWGDSLGDGTFKIGGLKEGTYVVTAFLEAGMFGLAPAVVAGAKSANVVLRPGGRLDVTIVGASGEPIAGAWPSVSRVDGVSVRMFGRPLRPTNDQGFTEMLVPSGDLVVGARKGPLNGSAEAHVDPGERGVLRITLKAGPTQAP